MKRNIKNFYRDLPLPKPEQVLPKEALPVKPSVLKRYRSAILSGAAAAAAVILCTVAVIRFLPSRGHNGEEYLPHLQPVESYLQPETERPSAETDPRESKKTDDADRMEDQTPADVAAATDFRLLHDKESGKFYFSFDGKMQEAGSGEVSFFMYLWTFDLESRFGSGAVLEPGVLILSSEELMAQLMVQFYHPATGEVRVLARESDFSFSHSSIDGPLFPFFVKNGEQYLIIDQPIWMNRLAFEDTIAVIEPDENGWPIVNTDRSTWSFLKTKPETQPETEPETKAPETTAPETLSEPPPREALINLEIMDGKFRFQRIATTPCIVYSNTPTSDMSKGTVYDDRHDILTVLFRATDNKDAIMDTSECEFSHYIYLFDKDYEDAPWHYRFAICNCGAVMITNNDELLCTIKITDEERQSILNALNQARLVVNGQEIGA